MNQPQTKPAGLTIKPVIAVEKSQNAKIGTVSATYVSQSSCPRSCPFFGNGCYAEQGLTGIHTKKLNKSTVTDLVEIAEAEAKGIRGLSGKYPLRLHVVGDCTTDECASIVSSAADEYAEIEGSPVWTYTHAHNTRRESWGKVSVLRSCENMEQVKQATEDGFASAMVVSEFDKETSYDIGDGYRGIPCPQQTGKAKTCVDCGLCQRDAKLRDAKLVVLFAAHGSRKSLVQDAVK